MCYMCLGICITKHVAGGQAKYEKALFRTSELSFWARNLALIAREYSCGGRRFNYKLAAAMCATTLLMNACSCVHSGMVLNNFDPHQRHSSLLPARLDSH